MTSRLSRRKQRSRAWLIVPLVVGLAAAGYGVYARVLAPAEAPAEAPLQTTTVRLELPMHPNVGEIEQILNEEHELIMTTSLSVEEGLEEATSRISEVLN